MPKVLILFDSVGGLTEQLAEQILKGAQSVPETEVEFCRIHETSQDVLLEADAVILGSPNYSGITGKLKAWFDNTGELWESGGLAGKPAAAFATGWSHAGLEATLLQLTHLLLANGFVFVGLPWTERMKKSSSYYGATATNKITLADKKQAELLGRRVALLAKSTSKE